MKLSNSFSKITGFILSTILLNPLHAQAAGLDPMLIPVLDDEALIVLGEDVDSNWGSRLALQPDGPDENLNREPWIDCPTYDDPVCDFNKPNYGPLAWTTFPICASSAAENCLADVEFQISGAKVEATYQGTVPGFTGFPANQKLGLHEGGVASLYRVDGRLYLVSARASLNFEKKVGKFKTNDFYINVIPVSAQPPSAEALYPNALPCIWRSNESCGIREEFPEDLRVAVEVRVTNDIGGWFLGRMKAPTVDVKQFSRTNNVLRVEASPVEVARFAYKTKKKDLTLEDRKATGNSGSIGTFESETAVRIGNGGYDDSNFGLLEHFRKRVKDTAIGATSHWSLRTTSRGDGNTCLADRSAVLGIVSTNAMVYDGFSPRFNNGFLDYRVAGLHFMPDGEKLVTGSYDLVMRSETARCLYGFTSAPVSATVQVVGTGDETIATTIVSEKDGWLKLAAYGFTFSEKKIKVRVIQPFSKAITKFSGSTQSLSSKQKAEIKASVNKAKSNPKFICTGTYVKPSDKTTALARARATCSYAKSLDKNHSYFAQAKQTKAASYNGKVLIVSK